MPMLLKIWWKRHQARVLSRHGLYGQRVAAYVGTAKVGVFIKGKEVS